MADRERQRIILHVDMDAFFASVEVRERPELAGKPVLVGGGGRRGVIAAASYEARRFGCHSAQPTAVALRLCPDAVLLPARHDLYAAVSSEIFAIFERYTPLVEGLSLDEAFLDMTGAERLFGPPRRMAESIRAEVRAKTHLTCSVGIASVKFVAKIASDLEKPDGLTEVPPGEEEAFLDPLPIRRLWGVGPKTAERLHRESIETIGDIRRTDPARLVRWLGEHGLDLHLLSRGIDERPIEPEVERKRVSHEDTYPDDLAGAAKIRAHLLDQASRVGDRLVSNGLKGRKVHLKIRDRYFVTQSRQLTLTRPTSDAGLIYESACKLLRTVAIEGRGFRLTGVGVSDFGPRADERQLDLFGRSEGASPPALVAEERRERLQEVVSSVRHRFGTSSLYRGDASPHLDRPAEGGRDAAKRPRRR